MLEGHWCSNERELPKLKFRRIIFGFKTYIRRFAGGVLKLFTYSTTLSLVPFTHQVRVYIIFRYYPYFGHKPSEHK